MSLWCKDAETRNRTGDLQIFSLTLSQLSYRGSWRISFAKVKRQDSIGTARIQGAALEVKPLHLFRAQGGHAETRDRTGDLQIFSLTLPQLSYRGFCKIYNGKRSHGDTRSTPQISTCGCTKKNNQVPAQPAGDLGLHQRHLQSVCTVAPPCAVSLVPRPGIEPGTFRASV